MYVSYTILTIPVIITCAVVATKSDSDVLFCLQLLTKIDRSLVH